MRWLFRTSLVALLVFAAYLALAAYAGFRVARGIDEAKASSLVTRVGTRLMGRDHVELLAIARGRVPKLITASPTFWMALRATE